MTLNTFVTAMLFFSAFVATGSAYPVHGLNGFAAAKALRTVNPVAANIEELTYHILHSREELDMGSALSAVPIIGPFLTPAIPILESVGLAGPSAAAVDVGTLTPPQIAALANLEEVLSTIVYNLNITSTPTNAESTVTSAAVTPQSTGSSNDSSLGTDGGTLETRGLLDLGSILAGLPIIGPFLKPLLPLLDSIGLGASSIASVDDVKTVSVEQATTLAKLEFMLAEAVNEFKAKSDSPDATSSVSPAQATSST